MSNMQVVALKCPSCGNGLSRESARCGYCGTVVIISSDQSQALSVGVACPECNATNNEHEKHCGQCGAVLLVECPKPRCLQENSVWRKYCKKCGTDIQELWRVQIDERIAEIQEKLPQTRLELKRVAAELESANGGEKLSKIIIRGAGVVISLVIVCSAGWSGILGVVIVMAVALVWAANHESDVKLMLLESAKHYLAEIEEFEGELKSLNERIHELDRTKA